MFLYANNAIKKSPCRYFLFCLDFFRRNFKIYPIYFHHFGSGILLKEKGYVKHVVKHASIYRDHFLRHYLFGSFTFFSIHQIRHSTTSNATPHRHKNVVLIVALKQQAIYIHHQYMQISFYPKPIKSY